MGGLESWREEQQSAYLYRVLARAERNATASALFERLARSAERQAKTWAGDLEAEPAPYAPTLRMRMIAGLVRVLGPRAMLPVLAAAKVRGLSLYRGPLATHSGAHAAAHRAPTMAGEPEPMHRSAKSGGSLRAAVFGVNDGLVSNSCLLLGLAGADPASGLFTLTGTAGLLAGAFSMAAGEYLSVSTQRDFALYQIELERAEIERYPEAEAEELALIYNARGLPLEEARRLAARLVRDPEMALDTLAREELGLDLAHLGSPRAAAAASFFAFAAGAAIPLLPFLLDLARPFRAVIALGAVALFSIGCGLSLFTGRGSLWGGLRMLLVGGSAGALTWWIGTLVGAALG
jgi:VIT1/CCC1 family predicted Fe2+/Mn2+ transporter